MCLEVVLGWSAVRITFVVLMPMVLSIAIGFWFQKRNPMDLITIQTSWCCVATYVVTVGVPPPHKVSSS
jgi:hypothetical protein